jgi:Flp pilus assembly protein TadG
LILSNPQEPYQPAQPDADTPGRQPPAGNRRKWVVPGIVGGALLLVIAGGVSVFNLVGGATNEARDVADDFTRLVIAGDTDTAYDDFLDPALQEKLSKEEFAAGVQSLKLNDTCKPTYSDLKVSNENGNNKADVAGVIGCDGKEVDLAYGFDRDSDMKMINIKLRPKD